MHAIILHGRQYLTRLITRVGISIRCMSSLHLCFLLSLKKVGIDYAELLHVKYRMVRRPAVVKVYTCLFVSLTIKAVHLEAVSDLTSEAFIAAPR